jgi:hypothetical protein
VPKGRVEKFPVEGLSPQDPDNRRADTVIEPANLLSSKSKPVLALMVALTMAARADDWPQFRGPRRDGHWNECSGERGPVEARQPVQSRVRPIPSRTFLTSA